MGLDNKTAASGLRYLFLSQLLIIIATVLVAVALYVPILAIVGLILMVLALVFSLVGIGVASGSHKYFKIAFIFTMINILVAFVSIFFEKNLMIAAILSATSSVLSILSTIFIILAASSLCKAKAPGVATLGKVTLWLYAIIIFVGAALSLLGSFEIIVFEALSLIISAASLVAYILYVVFLGKSSKVLA